MSGSGEMEPALHESTLRFVFFFFFFFFLSVVASFFLFLFLLGVGGDFVCLFSVFFLFFFSPHVFVCLPVFLLFVIRLFL